MDDETTTIEPDPTNLVDLTADIVSAYVSRNPVPPSELPHLLFSVHSAIAGLGAPSASAEPVQDKPTAAQIRKSIRPDSLVSFIDGKSYKTLKRHLTSHGLDAKAYRERFGLPSDYPMTAASYSEQRSTLAKAIGLGQSGRVVGPGSG